MDKLIDAVFTKLDADTNLGNLVSSVRFFRRPEEPHKLLKPVVVFNPAPGTGEIGLHGAASNVSLEFDVWGYQHDDIDMAPDCIRAGQRIKEIMVSTKFSLSRGGHLRWDEETTFNQIPQNDPDVILFRGTFGTRYWSGGSIDALIAAQS